MTELPDNPTREELREHYEASAEAPTECWENYGDVNPAAHGGNWVHYDGSGWDHRGTFMAEEIGYPDDAYDVEEPAKAQYVYASEVHWRDIVTEEGGWTDAARGTVESLANGHETPAGAVADGRLTGFVVAFADERREGFPRRDPLHTGEYAEILESVGVDPCEGEL